MIEIRDYNNLEEFSNELINMTDEELKEELEILERSGEPQGVKDMIESMILEAMGEI